MKNHGLALPEVVSRITVLLESRGTPAKRIKALLASTCGISVSAVHQWFNTTKHIKHEHLASIATAFDTSLDWIITGQGEMNIAGSDKPVMQNPTVRSPNLDQVKGLIDNAKAEILAIASSIEGTDVETAYRLTRLAIKIDEIKDVI